MLTPPEIKKETKKETKETKRAKQADPKIDAETLKSFINDDLTSQEAAKVKQVVQGFLWGRESLERYRVNVWMVEKQEGDLIMERNYIGKSYFLHYDSVTGDLEDKTIQEKPESFKI